MGIAIAAGTATVYAGLPEASSHRQLASLGAGQSYVITGLAAGEVVSVQSGGAFSYVLTMPAAERHRRRRLLWRQNRPPLVR